MTNPILGYEERLTLVDGQYDFGTRSYIFDAIHKPEPGSIVTQAFRLCRECKHIISSSGGPGWRSVCIGCYPALKIADFAQGHTHVYGNR